MLWRGRAPNGDVAAAATRRLEQLRVQYATLERTSSDPATDVADQADVDGSAEETALAAAGTQPEPQTRRPLSGGGRHVGPARRALSGRWGVTSHHVTVVALMIAAVVALAAWWVLRSVPEPQTVTMSASREFGTPSSTASPVSAGPPQAPTGAEASTAPTLVVDVAGRVRRPGIVQLPLGSRVIDALHAAGGARHGVDLTSINLARPLVDGEQLLVGLEGVSGAGPPPPGSPSSGSTPGAVDARVNLNTATQEQLEELPGIGPVTALAILSWREENGAFTTVEELLEVSGIGEATLAELEAYVHV